MSMVVSNRQRIHYRFLGERGAYLLLHHGLFGSHRDWYEAGYVEALADNFRLILVDARGHGRSDHPLEPAAYRLEHFADDVIAIMEELSIRNLHFLGYSLGALVGMELLLRHPQRVRITMMAGESPFVLEEMRAEWRELADRIGLEGFGPALEGMHRERRLPTPLTHPEAEGEKQAALALLEALQSLENRQPEDRLTVDSPVALFIGAEDRAAGRVQEARKHIHRARFVSLPGLDHVGLFEQREALLAEVLRLVHSGRKSEDAAREDKTDEGGNSRRGDRNRPNTAREPEPAPAPVEGDPGPSALDPPPGSGSPGDPGEAEGDGPPEAHETRGDPPGEEPLPPGEAVQTGAPDPGEPEENEE